MKAKIENVDIRGCEQKTSKKGGEYLLVRFEDETGKPYELVDKDIDRKDYYKRGTIGDLWIDIDQGRQYTNIRVIDFKQTDKEA